MTKVTIVGAGQSGLQLGIGLVQDGHDVTVISNRTGDDFRDGRVMSSQFMFANALDTERALGIDFWQDTCPQTEGIQFAIPHPEIRGEKASVSPRRNVVPKKGRASSSATSTSAGWARLLMHSRRRSACGRRPFCATSRRKTTYSA